MTEATTPIPTDGNAKQDNAPQLSPVAESKRIDAMDILRGIAVIGILLMNIEWFGRSLQELGSFDKSLTGLDHAAGWLIRCFVEGKFYKLFALLFGMGFAVMLIRAREVGRPFGAWFTRRMAVLFVFGLLHMIFLWGGDILHDYAFAGFLLLGLVLLLQTGRFSRFDNPKSILRIALIWLAFPFLASSAVGLGFGAWFDHDKLTARWDKDIRIEALVNTRMESLVAESEGATGEARDTESENSVTEPSSESESADEELSEEEQIEKAVSEKVEQKQEQDVNEAKEIKALTEGSYWRATKYRFNHALQVLRFTPFFTLLILLPIFLLGYWLIASGVIRNHRENRHIFKPMAIIGMSFGLFFTIGGLTVMGHPAADISGVLRATGGTLFFLGQYVLCAGYLGTIILMLGSQSWSAKLRRFAPLGRMALTNYIMHSLILTTLFYGYAGGLFGNISRAPQMLIVAAIITFQMYFSSWWLGRYRFGPLEWLWRSMTYKKLQPMKVSP